MIYEEEISGIRVHSFFFILCYFLEKLIAGSVNDLHIGVNLFWIFYCRDGPLYRPFFGGTADVAHSIILKGFPYPFFLAQFIQFIYSLFIHMKGKYQLRIITPRVKSTH